jgi:hypothetical protein
LLLEPAQTESGVMVLCPKLGFNNGRIIAIIKMFRNFFIGLNCNWFGVRLFFSVALFGVEAKCFIG